MTIATALAFPIQGHVTIFVRVDIDPLQGRLGLAARLLLCRLNHPLRPFGHHLSLLLLLNKLLLVTEGQGVRDAQQENTRRQHPQAFARVIYRRARRGVD